jgi:hypothetical protein
LPWQRRPEARVSKLPASVDPDGRDVPPGSNSGAAPQVFTACPDLLGRAYRASAERNPKPEFIARSCTKQAEPGFIPLEITFFETQICLATAK